MTLVTSGHIYLQTSLQTLQRPLGRQFSIEIALKYLVTNLRLVRHTFELNQDLEGRSLMTTQEEKRCILFPSMYIFDFETCPNSKIYSDMCPFPKVVLALGTGHIFLHKPPAFTCVGMYAITPAPMKVEDDIAVT